MKILRVGDPHITPRNLLDAENLISFIEETAIKNNVDRIEFMGDLFHTHAVIRMEVMDFWERAFDRLLSKQIEILTLVGNHDQPGSKEKEQEMNALQSFKNKGIQVIDKPTQYDNIGYIPYVSSENEFIKHSKYLYDNGSIECLVAHQTFKGASYENGFYAEDGFELELIPQKHIISGHIHKQQVVGKCHYIGTPKWDNLPDANEDKGIWLYEHNEDGSVKKADFISTRNIVTPIMRYVVKEEDNNLPEINEKDNNYLELVGSSSWIKQVKKKFKGIAKIKGRPTDRNHKPSVTEGKMKTLQQFLDENFQPINGVDKKQIHDFLKEMENE